MLDTYFKRKITLCLYYDSPYGVYLDDFTEWLSNRGFQHDTIRRRIHGIVQFSHWTHEVNIKLEDLTTNSLAQYWQYLNEHGRLVRPSGSKTVCYLGVKCFFDFLLVSKRLSLNNIETPLPKIIQQFEQWMIENRGVQQSTLLTYRHHLLDLLKIYGDNPNKYTTSKLRTFILEQNSTSQIEANKCRVLATRMFLRFLISSNRCDSNLANAIPPVARWRLSTLPKYLSSADVGVCGRTPNYD